MIVSYKIETSSSVHSLDKAAVSLGQIPTLKEEEYVLLQTIQIQ